MARIDVFHTSEAGSKPVWASKFAAPSSNWSGSYPLKVENVSSNLIDATMNLHDNKSDVTVQQYAKEGVLGAINSINTPGAAG